MVDIPSGWDLRAKQQPTGLIAYSADCVVRAALFKSCRPEYTKKDTRMGDSAFLVDIPSGWDPRAKQQPTGLIAYSANCVVRAALFKSCLAHTKKDTHPGVFFRMGQAGLEPATKRL